MKHRIFLPTRDTPLQKAIIADLQARQAALNKVASASATPSRKRLEELDQPQEVFRGLYRDAAQHLWRIEKDAEIRNKNAAYLTSKIEKIPGIIPQRFYEGQTRGA